VLKKTSAYTGLVIVTAAGALLTTSPAYALESLASGSHSSSHHRSHHRNRNWNGNLHHGRIFIRIYVYNKNNNHAVAIARPEHRRSDFRDPGRIVSDPEPPARRSAPGWTTPYQAPAATNPGTTQANDGAANSAPAAGTPETAGSTTGAAGSAPGTTGSAPGAPGLDEAATGGVSP
jgi:hypothetical protein